MLHRNIPSYPGFTKVYQITPCWLFTLVYQNATLYTFLYQNILLQKYDDNILTYEYEMKTAVRFIIWTKSAQN